MSQPHQLSRLTTNCSEKIIRRKNHHQYQQQIESSFSSSDSQISLLVNNKHFPQPDDHGHDLSTTTTTTNAAIKRRPFFSFRHQNRRLVDLSCFWPRRSDESTDNVDPVSAMATVSELLRVPPEIGKKKLGNQQKRQELQREVSMLQDMLNHEDKVREIFQQAYNRKVGCDVTIPNHLPPKMKELLSELGTVEDEIVRLETQIEKLRREVKTEQETTKESRISKHYLQSTAGSTNNHDHQRIGYETKALHFINKAITGSYSLTDFTISNKIVGSPTPGYSSSPYVQQYPKEVGLQERVVKRIGMFKPASPLRDFRHPTPKPKERSTESRVDLPRKYISGLTQVVEETSTGTKGQYPNKLSENIMKTLILIYVRLIRTSRQMELEKSGPISRSMYSSISFRTEPGITSLSTSFQKESKQQDPYAIFNVEGAILRDIGPYKNLVVFASSSLDPKYVSHSSSIPLFQKLRELFNSLQKVNLRSLTEQQKLAFWVNIYNACIMHGFLQFGLPSTPEKLLTLLNKATLNVGGKTVNAQAIERCILRKPTSYITKEGEKDSKEFIIHQLYGLESMNPNTIFALCCGTRSSPGVRIYTAEGVMSELEKSKLEYLQASISVTSSKRIGLPELLTQNMHDFDAKDMDSLVEWVCHQLPTSGSLRKSIVDCFRGLSNSGRISNVDKLSYDFEFQYLLQV